MSLAQRKAWEPYLAAYREDVDTAAAARCNTLAARVALGRVEGLAEAVTEVYLNPGSLPPACDPAFDWLRAQGLLSPELVERRARLALAAGEASLARYLARSLPAERAAPIEQWAALIEQPRASIEALIAQPARGVEPAALLDGWKRFARADAEAAAARYPALLQARALDARAASPFALAVAQALSWSRLPRSLEFFALGHPDDFDERAHEWHVRAALWAGDWARVRTAVSAMPEALRNQTRWRYWAARAAEQLGERDAARAGYAAVVPTDNWYAALAAARLGQRFSPTLDPLPRDEAEFAARGRRPGPRAHPRADPLRDAERGKPASGASPSKRSRPSSSGRRCGSPRAGAGTCRRSRPRRASACSTTTSCSTRVPSTTRSGAPRGRAACRRRSSMR